MAGYFTEIQITQNAVLQLLNEDWAITMPTELWQCGARCTTSTLRQCSLLPSLQRINKSLAADNGDILPRIESEIRSSFIRILGVFIRVNCKNVLNVEKSCE